MIYLMKLDPLDRSMPTRFHSDHLFEYLGDLESVRWGDSGSERRRAQWINNVPGCVADAAIVLIDDIASTISMFTEALEDDKWFQDNDRNSKIPVALIDRLQDQIIKRIIKFQRRSFPTIYPGVSHKAVPTNGWWESIVANSPLLNRVLNSINR